MRERDSLKLFLSVPPTARTHLQRTTLDVFQNIVLERCDALANTHATRLFSNLFCACERSRLLLWVLRSFVVAKPVVDKSGANTQLQQLIMETKEKYFLEACLNESKYGAPER